jgi:Protein of unknown function (DUF1214)
MSKTDSLQSLPTWTDQLRALEPVADRLIEKRGQTNPSEAERQDMYRLALSMLSAGYLCRVYMDPQNPTWVPLWNIAFNQGGPSPDYVYLTTDIDPKGVYRISGYRGTTRFVEITQQSWDMLSGMAELKPASATDDLDDLQLGEDGRFSVIVSAERPEGHTGDWWKLNPDTVRLLMRMCSCDWARELDARVSIVRLDEAPEKTTQDMVRRFSDLPAWVEGMISFDMELVRYYREHHGINGLKRSQVIDSIGGLPNQVYYDGIYEITDDEALIVDTALPRTCRYWQILVADDRFSTVDWYNRQSSLNDVQARVDEDGRFRAVISARDPGVPNWIDKADHPWGMIQMRWNKASDAPDPTIKKVAFADIAKHLPPDTPVVTPAERAEQLAVRRESAQMRRLW